VRQIEDAFKEFSARDDIAIILLSQYVSVFFQIQFTCNVTHLNCYVCTVLFKS